LILDLKDTLKRISLKNTPVIKL